MKTLPAALLDRLRAASDHILSPVEPPSIDEVARVTGIPRTTLYYHFSGREALIDALLRDKVARVGATLADGDPTDAASAEAHLERLLTAIATTIAEDPTLCTTLMARLALLPNDDPLPAAVERVVLRPLERVLLAGIADGVMRSDDPELSAHALYGAIATAALARFTRDGHLDGNRLARTLVPQLLDGVRAA